MLNDEIVTIKPSTYETDNELIIAENIYFRNGVFHFMLRVSLNEVITFIVIKRMYSNIHFT